MDTLMPILDPVQDTYHSLAAAETILARARTLTDVRATIESDGLSRSMMELLKKMDPEILEKVPGLESLDLIACDADDPRARAAIAEIDTALSLEAASASGSVMHVVTAVVGLMRGFLGQREAMEDRVEALSKALKDGTVEEGPLEELSLEALPADIAKAHLQALVTVVASMSEAPDFTDPDMHETQIANLKSVEEAIGTFTGYAIDTAACEVSHTPVKDDQRTRPGTASELGWSVEAVLAAAGVMTGLLDVWENVADNMDEIEAGYLSCVDKVGDDDGTPAIEDRLNDGLAPVSAEEEPEEDPEESAQAESEEDEQEMEDVAAQLATCDVCCAYARTCMTVVNASCTALASGTHVLSAVAEIASPGSSEEEPEETPEEGTTGEGEEEPSGDPAPDGEEETEDTLNDGL